MAKYRIVKCKHSEDAYRVDEKILGLFWVKEFGDGYVPFTLHDCEFHVMYLKNRAKIRKANSKDKIVKVY